MPPPPEADTAEGVCVAGSCFLAGSCGLEGDSCDRSTAGACCGVLVCRAMDTSGTTQCCARDPDACTDDSDCCGATTCDDGTCACREAGESCVSTSGCCGDGLCDGDTGRCE